MMKSTVFVAVVLLLLVATAQVWADSTVIWSDGFETYNTDSSGTWGILDNNLSSGPNATGATGTNPWFGPNPQNVWITKATMNPDPVKEMVTPYSGNFMMRGNRWSTGWLNMADNDIEYVNLAYRFNNGAAFTNDIMLDWYFYDIIGNSSADAHNFHDSAGLVYKPGVCATADYSNANGVLNNSTAQLRIGGASDYSTGYNKTVYQVQIAGASGGYANGWFNTSVNRTKGWHHAAIAVADGTVSFYIDEIQVLQRASNWASGYNVAEFRCVTDTPGSYDQSAYYDNVTLSRIPEPGSFIALGAGLLSLLGLRKRRS